MAGVTKEQIAKAKEWDLLSYLKAYEPQELKICSRSGNGEYCTVSHDSLRISNGKWNQRKLFPVLIMRKLSI